MEDQELELEMKKQMKGKPKGRNWVMREAEWGYN